MSQGTEAVQWPDVLRALGRDEVRSYALDPIRGSGFSADSFGARRNLEPLVEALIRTEDWLELEHPKWSERETVRAVRRILECRAYP